MNVSIRKNEICQKSLFIVVVNGYDGIIFDFNCMK